MSKELDDQIAADALEPKKVVLDNGVEVENRSAKDQIDAASYAASTAAAKSPRRGLVITKLSPPGTA